MKINLIGEMNLKETIDINRLNLDLLTYKIYNDWMLYDTKNIITIENIKSKIIDFDFSIFKDNNKILYKINLKYNKQGNELNALNDLSKEINGLNEFILNFNKFNEELFNYKKIKLA